MRPIMVPTAFLSTSRRVRMPRFWATCKLLILWPPSGSWQAKAQPTAARSWSRPDGVAASPMDAEASSRKLTSILRPVCFGTAAVVVVAIRVTPKSPPKFVAVSAFTVTNMLLFTVRSDTLDMRTPEPDGNAAAIASWALL